MTFADARCASPNDKPAEFDERGDRHRRSRCSSRSRRGRPAPRRGVSTSTATSSPRPTLFFKQHASRATPERHLHRLAAARVHVRASACSPVVPLAYRARAPTFVERPSPDAVLEAVPAPQSHRDLDRAHGVSRHVAAGPQATTSRPSAIVSRRVRPFPLPDVRGVARRDRTPHHRRASAPPRCSTSSSPRWETTSAPARPARPVYGLRSQSVRRRRWLSQAEPGDRRTARGTRARPAAVPRRRAPDELRPQNGWNLSGDAYHRRRRRLFLVPRPRRRHDHLRRLQHLRTRRSKPRCSLTKPSKDCACAASP